MKTIKKTMRECIQGHLADFLDGGRDPLKFCDGQYTGDDIPDFDIEYAPIECFPEWYQKDPKGWREKRDEWSEEEEKEWEECWEEYVNSYMEIWDDLVDEYYQEKADEEDDDLYYVVYEEHTDRVRGSGYDTHYGYYEHGYKTWEEADDNCEEIREAGRHRECQVVHGKAAAIKYCL